MEGRERLTRPRSGIRNDPRGREEKNQKKVKEGREKKSGLRIKNEKMRKEKESETAAAWNGNTGDGEFVAEPQKALRGSSGWGRNETFNGSEGGGKTGKGRLRSGNSWKPRETPLFVWDEKRHSGIPADESGKGVWGGQKVWPRAGQIARMEEKKR